MNAMPGLAHLPPAAVGGWSLGPGPGQLPPQVTDGWGAPPTQIRMPGASQSSALAVDPWAQGIHPPPPAAPPAETADGWGQAGAGLSSPPPKSVEESLRWLGMDSLGMDSLGMDSLGMDALGMDALGVDFQAGANESLETHAEPTARSGMAAWLATEARGVAALAGSAGSAGSSMGPGVGAGGTQLGKDKRSWAALTWEEQVREPSAG